MLCRSAKRTQTLTYFPLLQDILSIDHTLASLHSLCKAIVPDYGKDMVAVTLDFRWTSQSNLISEEDKERHSIFVDLLHALPRITRLEIDPLPIQPSLLSIAAAQSTHLTLLTLRGQEDHLLDPREIVAILRNATKLSSLCLLEVASADDEVLSSVVAAVRGLRRLRRLQLAFVPRAFIEGLGSAVPLVCLHLIDIPDVDSSDVVELLRRHQHTIEEVEFQPTVFKQQPFPPGAILSLPRLRTLSITTDDFTLRDFALLQTPALQQLECMVVEAGYPPAAFMDALQGQPRPALALVIVGSVESLPDGWTDELSWYSEAQAVEVRWRVW